MNGVTDWEALTFGDVPVGTNADWNAAADWNTNGYRLPTEMEWMWAATGAPEEGRDGGTNITGRLKTFAGSTGTNAIDEYAVFGYMGAETGRTTAEHSDPWAENSPTSWDCSA